MPVQIGSLFVGLTADFTGFSRNLQQADNQVATTSGRMRRNIGLTATSLTNFQRSGSNFGIRPGQLIAASRAFENVQQRANLLRGALFATTAAFGGLGAALTSNVISRYLDTFTSLQNQIRATSSDTADLAGTFAEVQKVADRSRSSLSAVATLYARLARASPGEAQDKILRRVETINKALQLGGATAQEAASAAIQFSQAIQSNRLGGDELRAVLETPLGGQLAKGLGVTIGEMRKMSIEGKLTADVVQKALDKISGSVDTQFARSFSTIDQALTVVDNKLVGFAGTVNQTYGVTRLLTGGINAFGNNLETIIPIVAQLATSLGVIFAGRLATSGLSKITGGFAAVRDVRKENLALAQKENDAAENAVQLAQRQADAAKAVKPETLVPRALQKNVERESAAAASIEKERLANIRTETELRTKLSGVTAQTSVAAVKASNAVIDAENKLNATLGRRQGLLAERVDNRAAAKALKTTGTVGTLGPDVVAAQQKIVSDRQRIAAQLIAVDAEIGNARDALAARTVKAAELETNAERIAAAERIAISKQLTAVTAQGALIRSQAQIQSGRIDNAKGNALGAGGTAAAAQISQTAGALYDAEKGANRTRLALQLAGREASALSIGFGLAGRAVGSFSAFLGGPWGVAITAAIGLLTYFGVKSQEAAQKIANAQQAIAEGLLAIGADDPSKQTSDEATALIDAKISALKAQIESVVFGMQNATEGIADKVNAAIFPSVGLGSEFDKLAESFQNVQDQFRAGTLTFGEYRAALLKLGADPTILDGLIKEAGDAKLELTQGAVVAFRLSQQLKILDGQKADIEVNVKLNDPAGVFPSDLARGRSRPPGDIKLNDLDPLNGLGSAPQDLQPTDFFHKQLIGRANDQGNPALNTEQKIKDRTQSVFEEGKEYGVTMAQAKQFATEELNLAEAQRKAAAQTKSATKDYEKFADKLRELKETGAAAGLGEIDKQVVDFARSLKDGSKLMAQYIDAVNSGDMSKAPKSLLEARDAFVQIAAASQATDIVKRYGEGAQVTKMFADEQEILNAAVANGSITAGQAQVAFADFLGEFGKYDWINKVSDAFGEFADAALDDFDNIDDAFASLIKSLEKTIIQATLIQPFQDWIKGALGQATGTANSGGSSGDIIGSLFSSIKGGSKVSNAGAGIASAAASTFASAGSTKGGISLSQVSTQGLVAKVDAAYADRFQGLFNDLTKSGYKISSLGEGGYSYRNVAGTNNLSKHAFGDAVDINPRQNPQAYGATGNFAASGIDPAALARQNGLKWGGDWNKPDTMHFQVDKSIKTLGDSADTAGKSLTTMNDNVMNVTKSLGAGVNSDGGAGLAGSLTGLFPQGNSGMLGNLQVGDHGSAFGAVGGAGGGIGGLFSSITDSIGGFLKGITDGIGSIFSSLFSGGGDFLSGILGAIGGIFGFAQGTNSAPKGMQLVGENGPELLRMHGGEVITPMSKLKTASMSPAMNGRMAANNNLQIEWVDGTESGVKRKTEKRKGPDGRDVLRVMIEDVVEEGLGSGRFDNPMTSRFGKSPKITAR